MTPPTHQNHTLPHPQGGHVTLSTLGFRGVPKKVVLSVHGFGSRRWGMKSSAVAWACADRGWAFATADFRGHGDSSGNLLELRGSGLQSDLDLVVDWLRSKGAQQIYLLGSSMGSWACSWLAVRRPEVVKACVLLAPSFNMIVSGWDKLSLAEQENWRVSGRLPINTEWVQGELGYGFVEERDQFPLTRLHDELKTTVRIIHGLRDEVVPWQGSLAFLEQSSSKDMELILIKEGDHRLSGLEDRVAELTCSFFA